MFAKNIPFSANSKLVVARVGVNHPYLQLRLKFNCEASRSNQHDLAEAF